MADKPTKQPEKPVKEAAPTEAAFSMRYLGKTPYPADVVGAPGNPWSQGDIKTLADLRVTEREAREVAEATGLFEVVKEGEK